MRIQTKLGLCALLAAALLAAAPSAQAIVYQFDDSHITGGAGQPPPYGTVTLVQNGANVDVTVDLAAGFGYVRTGSGDFQNFKFNGIGVALGDITVDAHTPALSATTGSYDGNGTGDFTFGIVALTQGNGGGNAFFPDIVFHVANATIADLTTVNNKGFIFAADVIAPNGLTGPIGVTGRPVPDGGATLALLGLGFASLGMLRRKLS